MVNQVTKSNELRFDLRRSQRVRAQLPVVVQGKLIDETPFVDPSRAVVLSAHGCLLTLSASVRLGERLTLRNVATREEQDCRVVYLGEKHGGRTEVGLRFNTASPQFWGLEHPPSDWRVPGGK
jgi:PilZ domain